MASRSSAAAEILSSWEPTILRQLVKVRMARFARVSFTSCSLSIIKNKTGAGVEEMVLSLDT